MPLAGQHHVVVAIEPELARRGRSRRAASAAIAAQSTPGSPCRRTTAHAADLARDAARPGAQHAGADMLHLGGVLRGGMHVNGAVFARNRERNLAFQIEMLLTTDAETRPRDCAARRRWRLQNRPGRTNSRAARSRRASASSTVTLGGSASTSTSPRRAARRAMSRVVATTAKTGCPWKMISHVRQRGSSLWVGEMSLRPGMSAAVDHCDDPRHRRTASRVDGRLIRPRATAAPPVATCSVPLGSGMSSI